MPDHESILHGKLYLLTDNSRVDPITPLIKEARRLIKNSSDPTVDLLSCNLQPFNYFSNSNKQSLIISLGGMEEPHWHAFLSMKANIADAAKTKGIDAALADKLSKIVKTWDEFADEVLKATSDKRMLRLKPHASILILGEHYYIDMGIARKLLAKDKFGFKTASESYGNSNTVRFRDVYFKPAENILDEATVYGIARCIEHPNESILVPRTYVEVSGVKIEKPRDRSNRSSAALNILNARIRKGQTSKDILKDNPELQQSLALANATQYVDTQLRASLAVEGVLLQHAFAAIDAYSLLKAHAPNSELLNEATFNQLTSTDPLGCIDKKCTLLSSLKDDAFIEQAAERLQSLCRKSGSRLGSLIRRTESPAGARCFNDVSNVKFQELSKLKGLVKCIVTSGERERLESLLSILIRYPGVFIRRGFSFYSLLNTFYGLRHVKTLMPQANAQEVFDKIEDYLVQAWDPANRDAMMVLTSLIRFSDLKADNIMLVPNKDGFRLILFDYDSIEPEEFMLRRDEHYLVVKTLWAGIPKLLQNSLNADSGRYANHYKSLDLREAFIHFLCYLHNFRLKYAEFIPAHERIHLRKDLYDSMLVIHATLHRERNLTYENLQNLCMSETLIKFMQDLASTSSGLLDFQDRLFKGTLMPSVKSLGLNDSALRALKSHETYSDALAAFIGFDHTSALGKSQVEALKELCTFADLNYSSCKPRGMPKALRRLSMLVRKSSDPDDNDDEKIELMRRISEPPIQNEKIELMRRISEPPIQNETKSIPPVLGSSKSSRS